MGNIGFTCSFVWEELSQEIQAMKEIQKIPDIVIAAIIIALFQLNRSAPAS
jgi:hypothetical protein